MFYMECAAGNMWKQRQMLYESHIFLDVTVYGENLAAMFKTFDVTYLPFIYVTSGNLQKRQTWI